MRRARAYNSTRSQVALVYIQPFPGNSLFAAKNCQKSLKPLFWSSRSFKVSDDDTTKKRVTSACMMSNISVAICNHFQIKQANIGKKLLLREYPFLTPECVGFLKRRGSKFVLLKFTFIGENFIRMLP